jgi:8-oxo-dGTP pyrophosphatase MutT (NUDIX family)
MKNEILPAVAAVIFNDHGEVLLQRRKDTCKWCLISGHVEFGETVEQAIIREIKEETTTEASIVRMIGVYSIPEFQTYHYDDRSVHYILTYFEAKLKEPLPSGYKNSETDALVFFPIDSLPDNLDQMNPNWLKDALSEKVFLR